MSNFVKIFWSIISLVPLLFVLTLVFFADALFSKAIPYSLVLGIIAVVVLLILFVMFFLIIKIFIGKLGTISFDVEEIESKDETVASSMMTYLLPLITITFTEINWIAFAGLIIVMLILLVSTRVVLLNPLLYLLGYKYYSIKAKSGAKYTLITKENKFNKSQKKIMVEIFNDIFIEVEGKDV